ncbi:MAG TPA: TetR/AcrR family transcriptional regulator [Sporichthya sp.]|nr:TetR/AcrR family transcriptional regulator [Sporichthya sp.]
MTEVAADGRGERASRRRARMREQLLDIAERAFTASAYQDVRMDDLAEEADISVGSIYGHFGSKDGLYLALSERAVEQMAAYLGQAVRPEYSPLERVMACGDAYLRFHLEHPGLFRFLAFDRVGPQTGQSDNALRGQVGDRLAEVIGWFEGLVADAIDSGEAEAGYDARLVSRFLWAAWNGVVALSLRADQLALTDAEVAACLQMGRRLVNEGLAAPSFRDERGRSRARLVDTGADPSAS